MHYILQNLPFARTRSHLLALFIAKLAVRTRPLAFGCSTHCPIGRSRAPARVWLLCSMSNWPFARARSYLVALFNTKLAARMRPLAFACFSQCEIGRSHVPARIPLPQSFLHWPFERARSYLLCLLHVEFAVHTRPLVFGCCLNPSKRLPRVGRARFAGERARGCRYYYIYIPGVARPRPVGGKNVNFFKSSLPG